MHSRFQDMDLIEVLWKQDVDLGFTLVEPATTPTKKPSTSDKESADEIEKLKALEAINATYQKVRKKKLLSFFLFDFNFLALFEFCIVHFLKSHDCAISSCFGFPITASNERLSLENAPLSAFTLEGSVCFLGLNLNVRFSICQRAH